MSKVFKSQTEVVNAIRTSASRPLTFQEGLSVLKNVLPGVCRVRNVTDRLWKLEFTSPAERALQPDGLVPSGALGWDRTARGGLPTWAEQRRGRRVPSWDSPHLLSRAHTSSPRGWRPP